MTLEPQAVSSAQLQIEGPVVMIVRAPMRATNFDLPHPREPRIALELMARCSGSSHHELRWAGHEPCAKHGLWTNVIQAFWNKWPPIGGGDSI
jgi:hypothetical protein